MTLSYACGGIRGIFTPSAVYAEGGRRLDRPTTLRSFRRRRGVASAFPLPSGASVRASPCADCPSQRRLIPRRCFHPRWWRRVMNPAVEIVIDTVPFFHFVPSIFAFFPEYSSFRAQTVIRVLISLRWRDRCDHLFHSFAFLRVLL